MVSSTVEIFASIMMKYVIYPRVNRIGPLQTNKQNVCISNLYKKLFDARV